MAFQIQALPMERFDALVGKSESELNANGVFRREVDCKPGYPCRVSLIDASVGETVLLMNYTHLNGPSPYRASHAIFVREQAETANFGPNEVPPALRIRLLSLRGFDANGLMRNADVVHGRELEARLETLLAEPDIAFVDIHNAKPGYFAARAVAC
ncbi:MAG: DUF1203 domain-containing protein [Pseudomonadota bacterium]